MKRTPLAAAVAAVFLLTTSSLFAQTGGTGTAGSTGSSAGTSSATGSNATSGRTATGTTSTTSSMKAGDKAGDKLARGDRKFLEEAAQDGMKEVEISRVAAQKASDPAVKSFAEQMVKDHTDANQKLMSLAQSKGVTPPAKMRGGDERKLASLQKMDAAKFDREYIDEMVKDHKKDTKEFDKQAKSAKDPDVQKFAADTAPNLHRHLDMVTDIQKNLGKGTARSGSAAGTSGAATSAAGTRATTGSTSASGSAPASGSTGATKGTTGK